MPLSHFISTLTLAIKGSVSRGEVVIDDAVYVTSVPVPGKYLRVQLDLKSAMRS